VATKKMENLAEKLFTKWEASLYSVKKDKQFASIMADELFFDLSENSIDFDLAYKYIEKTIEALSPPNHLIKRVHKIVNFQGPLNDFANDWKLRIKEDVFNSFYTYYEVGKQSKDSSSKYGSMSAIEYKRQRAYANSHEEVDLNTLPPKKMITDEELESLKKHLKEKLKQIKGDEK
jgi:hypothetical protein